MATTHGAPALRRLLLGRYQHQSPSLSRAQLLCLPGRQARRWAQVCDVRPLAAARAAHDIADRYRAKLESKARAEGHGGDVGSLKAAYADRIADQRRRDQVSVPGLDALLADEEAPPSSAASSATTTASQTQQSGEQQQQHQSEEEAPKKKAKSDGSRGSVKPLSEILDLDKARALPAKELGAIWRLRHAANPASLCAAVPAATFAAMEAAARRHPTFVLPVPREGEGAEIHLLQWVFDDAAAADGARTATVLFTQLAEYKARGEWAQPHTSATHYVDGPLAAGQGVVLMAGSLVEGRGASVQDAQWLVMLMQRFYGGVDGGAGGGEKMRLVEEFSKGGAGSFTIEKLLEESEKLG